MIPMMVVAVRDDSAAEPDLVKWRKVQKGRKPVGLTLFSPSSPFHSPAGELAGSSLT